MDVSSRTWPKRKGEHSNESNCNDLYFPRTVYFVVQAAFSLEILKCEWPFKINGGNTLHDIHALHIYTYILHDNFFHIDFWNN